MKKAIPFSERVVNVRNQKLDDEDFFEERKKVLSRWHTGSEIDLEEGISFQQSLPEHKNAVYRLKQAKKEGRVLTQPRGGICLIDEYIKLLKQFQDKGKADILTAQSDSYTRNERFDLCEKAWNESKELGRSKLNGCPWANWGVKESRRLIEAIDVPLDGRGGTDIFSVEVTISAGATSFLGGFLNSLSYSPTLLPEVLLRKQQQVYRLQGYYTERGVPIVTDSHALSGPSYPVHSLEVAQVTLEALIAAAQGVKSIIVRCRQTFNLTQDIAKARAHKEFAANYMEKFGFSDVDIFLGFEDWVAAFPQDWAQASGMVALGAVSAHFSGSQNIMIKSLDEGLGLPSTEAQIFSLRETKQVLNILKREEFPFCQEVENEKNMILKEATLIIEKVIELGDGDIALGCIKALDLGVIDHPFSSSFYTAGKVLPTRDIHGRVRYLDCGNLPFTKEIIEYHREKVNERRKTEHLEKDYMLMLQDISTYSVDFEDDGVAEI